MDLLRAYAFHRHVPSPAAVVRMGQTCPSGQVGCSVLGSLPWLKTSLFWDESTRLIDSSPVPCGLSRETVKRSNLAGYAGYAGYGCSVSHSRNFWGFRLYLLCTLDGTLIAWALANPTIGEPDAAKAIFHQGAASDLPRAGDHR